MSSAAALIDEIHAFAREAISPLSPLEEAAGAKREFLASAETVAVRARALKERTEILAAGLERFIVALRQDPRGVALDEVIGTLRMIESTVKAAMGPYINRAKATRRGVFAMRSLTSGERARAIGAVDRYVTVLNESLAMLRDYRWQVMTFRAELEDAGDSPVFDDAEELIQYLNAQSG